MGRLLGLLKQSVSRAFGTVLVTGEVVDPLLSQRGHLYFRLTDGGAEIKAVMWRSDVQRLRAPLEAGDQVTVRGNLDVYAPRGDLQLVASALMQSGRGQKLLALAQLKSRLKAEGLFDRPRRDIPPFPRRVGVVTSVGSAVIHDIYQCVQKRFPSCQLILSPAAVSGEAAPAGLIDALRRLEERTEVVIIARGGGSFEELLPFSDEKLVRAVAGFSKPVVAAVGHGSDLTILDLVADHTAPTPTAAAVLVTPDTEELRAGLTALRERARRGLRRTLEGRRHSLERATARCRMYHPEARISRHLEKAAHLRTRLTHSMNSGLRRCRQEGVPAARLLLPLESRLKAQREQLVGLSRRLQSSGPQTLLKRGFAMVYSAQELVTGCGGRTVGEELELHFADGRIVAEIKRVEQA